jgi:hypothetical protein
MRPVIESAAESGDGVSIEREQPSTAFRSMPHLVTFVQPQSIDAQMGELRSDHIGAFKALNETTNFDDKGYSPISGEGVFKPQDIDTKGSVIFGDNHFKPGRGGDSLTGEGRPTKIWTNGGASTFEDRHVGDYDANDAVFSMRENIDWTAANGGPGSSYLTAKNASQSNAYVDEDVDGFMKLGDIRGELQTTDLRSDNRFVIERFQPLAEMNSFGESLNPVAELGGKSGPGGTTFMTGSIGCQTMPPDNIGSTAGPGGSTF